MHDVDKHTEIKCSNSKCYYSLTVTVFDVEKTLKHSTKSKKVGEIFHCKLFFISLDKGLTSNLYDVAKMYTHQQLCVKWDNSVFKFMFYKHGVKLGRMLTLAICLQCTLKNC